MDDNCDKPHNLNKTTVGAVNLRGEYQANPSVPPIYI